MTFERSPLSQGADLAIDRIIQEGVVEQVAGTPPPEVAVPPADALRFAGFAGTFLIPSIFQRTRRGMAPRAPALPVAPAGLPQRPEDIGLPGPADPATVARLRQEAGLPPTGLPPQLVELENERRAAQGLAPISPEGVPVRDPLAELSPVELAFARESLQEGRGLEEILDLKRQGFSITEDGLEKEIAGGVGEGARVDILLIDRQQRVFINDRRIGDIDEQGQFQPFELPPEQVAEFEEQFRERRGELKEEISRITRLTEEERQAEREEQAAREAAFLRGELEPTEAAFEAVTAEEARERQPLTEEVRALEEQLTPVELRLRAEGIGNEARRQRIIAEVTSAALFLGLPVPSFGGLARGAAALAERGGALGLFGRGAFQALRIPAALEAGFGRALTAPFRGAARILQGARATRSEAVVARANKILADAVAGRPVPSRDLTFIRRQGPELFDDLNRAVARIQSKPARMAIPPAPATEAEQIVIVKNKLQTVLDEFARVEKEIVGPAKKAGRIRQAQAADEAVGEIRTIADIERVKSVRAGQIIPEVELPAAQLTPVEDALLVQSIHDSAVFQELLPNARLNTFVAFNKLLTGERIVQSERVLLEEVLGITIASVKTTGERVFGLVKDIVTFPQRLLASTDNSFPLRQALIVTVGEPVQAIKAFKAQQRILWAGIKGRSVKALRAEAAKVRRELANSEFGVEMGEGGMFLGRPGNPEEAFLSKLISRIPFLRDILGPILSVSEELATTYVNVIRAGIFDKWARANAKTWGPQQYRQLSRLINIATGRGVIPGKKEVIDLLNGIFFAPRLVASRIQMPFAPFFNQPATVRLLATRWIVGMVGTISATMKLLEIGGVIDKIETDPRSTDFMKMRVGNTRIDPWGGYQQWVTLIARLLTNERKSSTGEIVDVTKDDVTGRFVRSKLSPAAAAAWDVITGESFIGETISTAREDVQREAFNRLVPLFIQDVREAMEEDGWQGGLAASPGFFGWGITAYPSRQFVEWTDAAQIATGMEFTRDEAINLRGEFEEVMQSWEEFWELPRGRARNAFRRDNPEVDASLHFWGEVSDVKTPEAAAIVQQLLDKFEMPDELLPIMEEKEPFDEAGLTQDDIFFSFVETVPSFFADFILENRDQFDRANLPEAIRAAEVEFTNLRRLRSRYRLATKGQTDRERERFRASNPELDAALVLLGDVSTFKSTQAREQAIRLAEQLGIPQDIIPAFQPRPGRARGVSGGGAAPAPAGGFQVPRVFQAR